MSKVEVQVIDDKLLTESILGTDGSNNNEADEIVFNLVDAAIEVQALSLSFKKIGRIENLVGFDKLVKLCLDNNLIEDIINLGHLKNLKWLDLSFNKIRKIQGLESLQLLEDLTLFSNKISIVEGLDCLPQLKCLSIGNNRIESLEQVIRLRQLKTVRMLTLSGNPVCNEAEYKMTVLAFLDNLKYLDYALVDTAERNIAKEQYHDELLDVEEKESVVAEKFNRDKALDEYLTKLDKAKILFSYTIFDDMFSNDVDVEKLKHMPGVKELVDHFKGGFKALSDDFIKVALEKDDKRMKEQNDFERSVKALRLHDDQESTQLVESFLQSKKTVSTQLTDATATFTRSERLKMIKKLQEELERVCDELLSIEVRQVEKFEGILDEYDTRLVEMKALALEMQTAFFRSIEELEDKFSGQVKAVAIDLIDRLSREELAEDYLDDEAMSLVVDKDSCMGILSASHDLHVGRILKREDEARFNENKRYQEAIASYSNDERKRNRDRILQIHEFSVSNANRLNALTNVDDDDAFEEEEAHK